MYFDCKCDCGNDAIVTHRLSTLITGKSKSCGCIKFNNPLSIKDLTGERYGRLTVLGRDIKRDENERNLGKHVVVHWLCKCGCGNPNLSSITGYQLTSGHTQSCGCYASEQISKRNKKYSTKFNEHIDNKDGTTSLIDDNKNICLIDTEDYDLLKNWYWRKQEKRGNIDKGYWITNVKNTDVYNKSILMIHQVVAEIKYGINEFKEIIPDHLSRDTDDNRKCNIYLKPNIENSHNRGLSKTNKSGKTGVSFDKAKNKWHSYITVNYKTIHLGYFNTFEEAVIVRKEAEKKYNFACDDEVKPYDTAS